jgi:hypothetical protein
MTNKQSLACPKLEQVLKIEQAAVAVELDTKHIVCDAIPFLSYKDDVCYVKTIDTNGTQHKGKLFLESGTIRPQVIFEKKRYGREFYDPKDKIIKYRRQQSKRWRAPKEEHKATIAYYTLVLK